MVLAVSRFLYKVSRVEYLEAFRDGRTMAPKRFSPGNCAGIHFSLRKVGNRGENDKSPLP